MTSLRTTEPSFGATLLPDADEAEVPFGFKEIFFSRTDARGVIQAGNSVFRRVSGYDWPRLIGAPHRIIRHPAMPKAAFHLLWDRLRAGRPTGVYVRNRSVEGGTYWVFAIVVPIRDGFLSVRIKPGTATFGRVQGIYADLRAAESRGLTPAEGATELLVRLGDDGFPSYDSFQARALAAEIMNRAGRRGHPAPRLAQAIKAAEAADRIGAELAATQRVFDSAMLIAMNLRITATRLGDRPLTAISNNYALVSSDMASWLDKRISGSDGGFEGIARSVSESLFLKNATTLLDEMSETFARDGEVGSGDAAEERARLAEAAAQYRERAEECNERAVEMAIALESHLGQMRHRVTALDSIRMLCRVEGAGLCGTEGSLDQTVSQFDGFQDDLGARLARTMLLGQEIQDAAAVP
ncbi:putative PAS/PAC sensor protein [Rubellimicrobium mesophilum DSM 19309]|uniref:Putative PAS/PAC sensor protein n=1 Tax=Rubellimicrobium mesophilum DSM 19309 TaxID=442562 RepID=A0A017HVX7_9RHOB|nr:PAS domain-containing protein [Rubellimicrobium mesophilum]EYD77909.1 putative PAS/PAC sensor protein [Rubellimicrobium mesophilum DSM 19309]